MAPHNRHQRAGIFAAYTWVGINVELPSEQAGAVLQAVIGPRLSRPLAGVVLRQIRPWLWPLRPGSTNSLPRPIGIRFSN